MKEKIGEIFQAETKYHKDQMPQGRGLEWEKKPSVYKIYPERKKIVLPPPEKRDTLNMDQVLRKRRSVRKYSEEPLKIQDLSYILWACQGIQRREKERDFRTVPSAGALYPIENYLVVNNVETLSSGIYHYNIKEHALEELKTGDLSMAVTSSALGQDMCGDAPAVLVWTAIFQRCKWKYGQRAYRYVYLDAGHIAQNLALICTAMGLGSCQIAAFFDDEVNKLIGVDGEEESVLFMSVVGVPFAWE